MNERVYVLTWFIQLVALNHGLFDTTCLNILIKYKCANKGSLGVHVVSFTFELSPICGNMFG